MVELCIKENEAGQRLDKYLQKYMKEAEKNFLYKMLRKKNIVLNGKKAEGNEKLCTGDTVKLFLSDETIEKFGGRLPGKQCAGRQEQGKTEEYGRAYKRLGELKVIFENRHVLIVHKPAGILAQKAEPGDLSLNEWLVGYLLEKGEVTAEELHTFRPSVCNRLDRNTSGMVICGKTLPGSQCMGRLLKDRSLHKYYRLYVKGRVEKASFSEGYLVKDGLTNKARLVRQGEEGAYIRTDYRPLKHFRDMTLVEAELVTGKPHQLRLQFSGLGHPLLGDYKYGEKDFNDKYRKRYGVRNQLLHAYRLEFPVMEGDFRDLSGLTLVDREPEVFRRIEEGESEGWQHGIPEG